MYYKTKCARNCGDDCGGERRLDNLNAVWNKERKHQTVSPKTVSDKSRAGGAHIQKLPRLFTRGEKENTGKIQMDLLFTPSSHTARMP
jgi:hypothetical protein